MGKEHTPVLLHDVIQAFQPEPGKLFIDATIGFGGHAFALINRGARVLGIDRDTEELALLEEKRKAAHITKEQLILAAGSFIHIKRIAYDHGFSKVDGILYDLGFSSWHIEKSGRGFSFMRDEPLDLRFDRKSTETTGADVLNTYSKHELSMIFARYGELEQAEQLAEAIVKNRPLWKTSELNRLIASTQISRHINQLLARIYQALRITVNEELVHIEVSIADAIDLLKTGGVIGVISFHSLEDRVVKLAFRDSRLRVKQKTPIVATNRERMGNIRSRSAKLRIAYTL